MEPITRSEQYLASIIGEDVDLPVPQSRIEHYLNILAQNGIAPSSAGLINYDPETAYPDGSMGAGLQEQADALADLKSQMNNSITPYITDAMTAPAALSVGDYVMAANTLYRVIAPIANGATLTPNTNVVATTEADELKRKANTNGNYPDMTVGNAEQLVATVGVEDKVPYNFRTSGGSADIGDREVDELVGGTVAWNQMIRESKVSGYAGTLTVSNGVYTLVPNGNFSSTLHYGIARSTDEPLMIANHVYFATVKVKSTKADKFRLRVSDTTKFSGDLSANQSEVIDLLCKGATNLNLVTVYAYDDTLYTSSDALTFSDFNLFDLTQMFGSTIADYIYSLEQNNAGDGIAWFRKLFPKDYYAYDAGTLMSVKTSAHKMVGFNAFDKTTVIADYYINDETGVAAYHSGDACTDYIPVIPNATYCITTDQTTGAWGAIYDSGKNYIGSWAYYVTNKTKQMPSNAAYVRLTVVRNGDGNVNTFCLNLSWDGSRDGEYEPYEAHTYALDSDLELRGIPKLDADNKLYYDGDTYKDDGTVTRKYGIIDLGSLTWVQSETVEANSYRFSQGGNIISNIKYASSSTDVVSAFFLYGPAVSMSNTYNNIEGVAISTAGRINIYLNAYKTSTADAFKTAMNGVYLVYELATPTTESADPYTNPQIVNDFGTEEYVDSRDVPIPVGHVTQYQANLRAKLEMAPDSPDGDGDYIVRQSSGQNTYVPLVLPLDELPAAPGTDGTYVLKVTVASGEATYSWVSE